MSASARKLLLKQTHEPASLRIRQAPGKHGQRSERGFAAGEKPQSECLRACKRGSGISRSCSAPELTLEGFQVLPTGVSNFVPCRLGTHPDVMNHPEGLAALRYQAGRNEHP